MSKTNSKLGDFLQSLEIADIRLAQLRANITAPPEGKEPGDLDLSMQSNVESVHEDENLGTLLPCRLRVAVAGLEASGTGIDLQAEYLVLYRVREPVVELDEPDGALRDHLAMHVIPLARQLFRQLSLEMGLSPILLPLYKVGAASRTE